MRLTHLVSGGGCASKLGPAQLTEVLRHIPQSAHPNLLVGFENRDDAGVFALPDGQALVQTIDFFTPIVDDPFAYGQIAAANALSDIYAMGGRPLTVMNVACFDPILAEPDIWSEIFRGMYEKTAEAEAVVLGGHSVVDPQPKFGLSVTGLVEPDTMFLNKRAKVGEAIYLSKPLGTGIITTAAKNDAATSQQVSEAIESMVQLNRRAAEVGLEAQVRCATDITGFGLAGHLLNIAKGSEVAIEIKCSSLPLMSGLKDLIEGGHTTGGCRKNREYLGTRLHASRVEEWMVEIAIDPQTSGGLALISDRPIGQFPQIGRIVEGEPGIFLVP